MYQLLAEQSVYPEAHWITAALGESPSALLACNDGFHHAITDDSQRSGRHLYHSGQIQQVS
jgi:hypothetical protein